MQPDHATPSHWNSLSQNWFRPPMNPSPFFPISGLHSDSTSNMSRLSEQMIHNPSGDKPISRMPAHLNPSAIPSLPSNYLPTVNGYYSLSPASQDALTSRPIPYRVVEHGAIGAVDAERDYLNQLFEKPKAAGGTGGEIFKHTSSFIDRLLISDMVNLIFLFRNSFIHHLSLKAII